MRYKLRIPELTLDWIRVDAIDEKNALDTVVKMIASKSFDYSYKPMWEIEIEEMDNEKK